jgi:hypothetical protein
VEEYCWAIKEAAGRSCCGRSGPSAFGFWISTGLPFIYVQYVVDLLQSIRNVATVLSRGQSVL